MEHHPRVTQSLRHVVRNVFGSHVAKKRSSTEETAHQQHVMTIVPSSAYARETSSIVSTTSNPNTSTAVMDIVSAVSDYVGKMLSSTGAGGSSGKMKVLLLDSETVC